MVVDEGHAERVLAPGPGAEERRPGSSFVLVGERTEGLVVGAPAPALAGTGTDGEPVLLRDLSGTPIDLAALLHLDRPVVRARYEYADAGDPTLGAIVDAALGAGGPAR